MIQVRAATAADQAVLGRFGAALMRLHHDTDPKRFIMTAHPEAGYGRFLVSQIGDADSLVLVAQREADVIGYLFAGIEPTSWMDLRGPCGYIHDVYVEERARRLGAARELVRTALTWVGSRGMTQVGLTSMWQNQAAQHLFASLGFRHTMVEMTIDLDGSGPGAR